MLKRDTSARFEKVGFAFLSRYHFVVGSLDVAMSKERHAAIARDNWKRRSKSREMRSDVAPTGSFATSSTGKTKATTN